MAVEGSKPLLSPTSHQMWNLIQKKIQIFSASLLRLTWQCCSASSNTAVLLPIRPTPMLSRTILLLRLTATGDKWWGFTSARNLPKLSVTVTSGSGCFKTEWSRVKKENIHIHIHISLLFLQKDFFFTKRQQRPEHISIPLTAALCRPLYPLIGLIVLWWIEEFVFFFNTEREQQVMQCNTATAKQYFSPYLQCGDHGLSQVFPPPEFWRALMLLGGWAANLYGQWQGRRGTGKTFHHVTKKSGKFSCPHFCEPHPMTRRKYS